MIASWVAQASFEPLGITVAVAKDRAIESLMQVRDALKLMLAHSCGSTCDSQDDDDDDDDDDITSAGL